MVKPYYSERIGLTPPQKYGRKLIFRNEFGHIMGLFDYRKLVYVVRDGYQSGPCATTRGGFLVSPRDQGGCAVALLRFRLRTAVGGG
jgi:hypothetical protein